MREPDAEAQSRAETASSRAETGSLEAYDLLMYAGLETVFQWRLFLKLHVG